MRVRRDHAAYRHDNCFGHRTCLRGAQILNDTISSSRYHDKPLAVKDTSYKGGWPFDKPGWIRSSPNQTHQTCVDANGDNIGAVVRNHPDALSIVDTAAESTGSFCVTSRPHGEA